MLTTDVRCRACRGFCGYPLDQQIGLLTLGGPFGQSIKDAVHFQGTIAGHATLGDQRVEAIALAIHRSQQWLD